MSLTSLVLAFAGGLAAKVKPAPIEAGRLEVLRLKAELETAYWALRTATGELAATRASLRQMRVERDMFKDALERHWRQQQPPHYQVNEYAAQAQAQQYQAQQNRFGQSLGLLGQQDVQGMWQHDCKCVPGRAGMLRGLGA